jgi:hypothetical protein
MSAAMAELLGSALLQGLSREASSDNTTTKALLTSYICMMAAAGASMLVSGPPWSWLPCSMNSTLTRLQRQPDTATARLLVDKTTPLPAGHHHPHLLQNRHRPRHWRRQPNTNPLCRGTVKAQGDSASSHCPKLLTSVRASPAACSRHHHSLTPPTRVSAYQNKTNKLPRACY